MKTKRQEFGYCVKYNNRKCYHVNESRYVTLKEMGEFGDKLVVVDNKTKRDITARIKLLIEFNKKLKELE